jgi:hypothetical protein
MMWYIGGEVYFIFHTEIDSALNWDEIRRKQCTLTRTQCKKHFRIRVYARYVFWTSSFKDLKSTTICFLTVSLSCTIKDQKKRKLVSRILWLNVGFPFPRRLHLNLKWLLAYVKNRHYIVKVARKRLTKKVLSVIRTLKCSVHLYFYNQTILGHCIVWNK